MAKYIKTEEGYIDSYKINTHYDSRKELSWLVGNDYDLKTITLNKIVYDDYYSSYGVSFHIINNVDINIDNKPNAQIAYYDNDGQLCTQKVNLPFTESGYDGIESLDQLPPGTLPNVLIDGCELDLMYYNLSHTLTIGLKFSDGSPRTSTSLSLCVYEGELVQLDDKYITQNIARVKNVLTKTNMIAYTPTENYHPATKKYVDDILQKIYPVGAIYLSMNSTSPASMFGGTWEQIEDRFLLGAGTNYAAGTLGGSAEHTHNTALQFASYSGAIAMEGSEEVGMVSYSTDGTKTPNASTKIGDTSEDTSNSINAGSQSSKTEVESLEVYETEGNTSYASNMPPYLVVYMWKRIK